MNHVAALGKRCRTPSSSAAGTPSCCTEIQLLISIKVHIKKIYKKKEIYIILKKEKEK